MISPLPGWSWAVRQGGITMVPSEGLAFGVIRYEERVRPLLSIGAILQHKATDQSFQITSMTPPERLISDEGEYAALVIIDGALHGVPVRRAIGFVFGDDYYAAIAGLAMQSASFERITDTVRTLVRTDRHMLGIRRRRYLFKPPPGWNGIARLPLCAYYYPPDYPNNPSVLCVYPAMPKQHFGESWILENMRPVGGPRVARVLLTQDTSNAELTGTVLRCVCEEETGVLRDVVILTDDRYVYPLSLDAPESLMDGGRAQLSAVTESLQPIPHSAAERKNPSTALSFWA